MELKKRKSSTLEAVKPTKKSKREITLNEIDSNSNISNLSNKNKCRKNKSDIANKKTSSGKLASLPEITTDDVPGESYTAWKKSHPKSSVNIDNKVLDIVLRDLKTTQKKDKFKRTCSEGYESFRNLINWDSPSFIFRIIRNVILNKEWINLKDLLRILLHHKIIYKNYVKEITHLYYLINADSIDPLEIEEYYQLCFSNVENSTKFKEFDIWYNEKNEND